MTHLRRFLTAWIITVLALVVWNGLVLYVAMRWLGEVATFGLILTGLVGVSLFLWIATEDE